MAIITEEQEKTIKITTEAYLRLEQKAKKYDEIIEAIEQVQGDETNGVDDIGVAILDVTNMWM